MKFINFVDLLKDNRKLIEFLKKEYPDIDYYDAEVYLENEINPYAKVKIFDYNKIDGKIKMKVNNKTYINLFTLDLLVELFNDFKKMYNNDNDIAKRIIEYRINDA